MMCRLIMAAMMMLGIATLNDILDALVGDLSQTDEFNYDIVERADGSFLIDAQLPWEDFLDHFDIINETKYFKNYLEEIVPGKNA